MHARLLEFFYYSRMAFYAFLFLLVAAELMECYPGKVLQNGANHKNDAIARQPGLTGYIVSGEDAEMHEFPFAVLITDFFGDAVCGGTLISSHYVLTAAHCIRNQIAANIFVHLGEHDKSTLDETVLVTSTAEKLIPHPKFNFFATVNDIALIKLSQPIAFTNAINATCLPADKSYAGEMATVVGWGSLRPAGLTPSVLQKLQVEVLEKKDCKKRLGDESWWLTDLKLCAWAPNKNACEGDSGGPLLSHDSLSVIGVVSFGDDCGITNTPSIYTRVSRYQEWIMNTTKDDPPCILR